MNYCEAPNSRLLVDFESSGHHSKYLQHLVRYGLGADSGGSVQLLISGELAARAKRELTVEEQLLLSERTRLIEEHPAYRRLLKWIRVRAIVERVFVEYLIATQRQGCEMIFLYLDPFLLQLACLPIPRKCVSGLLFRTSFHYWHTRFRIDGAREYLLFLVKYLMCYLGARRGGLRRILVLDPFAQSYAEGKWRTTKYITIPDPVGPEPDTPASYFTPRQREGDSRRVLLLCGELSRRKGVLVVLRALAAMEPQYLRQVKLQLVGPILRPERNMLLQELGRFRERDCSAEITLDDRFVSDAELDCHFANADAVLTLYERSFGSSGTVIRAAAFSRPVIATNQGLVGHLVRLHRLGAVVNVRDISAVTGAFRSFIGTGVIAEFDSQSAREYAESCAPPVFAAGLLAFESMESGSTTVHDQK